MSVHDHITNGKRREHGEAQNNIDRDLPLRGKPPLFGLALNRVLEQERFRHEVDRKKQAHPEIGRERQFARRSRAEPFKRELPIDKGDQEIDDARGDDRLGVDEESADRSSIGQRQAGAGGSHRWSKRHDRKERGCRESRDHRSGGARLCGDPDHDREGQRLADPRKRRIGAPLRARAHLRGGIVAPGVSDRHQRHQPQEGSPHAEVDPQCSKRSDRNDRGDNHRDIARLEACSRRLAAFAGGGKPDRRQAEQSKNAIARINAPSATVA
jgi:hypothetical protein